jgi:hypothetical protein
MTLRTNSAEGGTSGNSVNPSNSGGASGTAFNSVFVTGGFGVITYDNAQAAHGTLSIRGRSNSGSAVTYVQWNCTAASSFAARIYLRLNALPSGSFDTPIYVSGCAAFVASASTGKFQIFNAAFTAITTFATPFATGVWYRLELEGQAGTTTSNGYIAGRYFIGDSTTPVNPQFSSNTVNAGTGTPISNVQMGWPQGATTPDYWMDDLAFNDGTTTPIGPAVPAAVPFAGWGIPV